MTDAFRRVNSCAWMATSARWARALLPRSAGGVVALALLMSGANATCAIAQQNGTGGEEAKRPDQISLLEDFIHFVRINRTDVAKSLGTELLGHNLSPTDFVKLVESTGDVGRFEDTIQRALRMRDVEPVAAQLGKAFDNGKLARARDPQEIARNIKELTGTLRGRILAEERLVYAGEYAMPQLLEAFLDGSNLQRQVAVQNVMKRLGRQAVIPLVAALPQLAPAQQERAANLLGQIPWQHSVPFLADLGETSPSEPVRAACVRAVEKLGGMRGLRTSELYRQLAEDYYAEKQELTSFPKEDFQLLWSFRPASGLVMQAIRTPVFHEALCMNLCERALELDSKGSGVSPDLLALWVSANYSREIDTPTGYVNPAYPIAGLAAPDAKVRRPADYFASASGADVSQRVLARALDSKDTPLARKALGAVGRTAGGTALSGLEGRRQPLVEALTYPNRRVQFESALAIAAAQPTTAFPGSERVVPTLAGTLRGASSMTAAIVANDAEQYQVVRRTLEKLGYSVMPQGRALSDLGTPLAEAAAVDLVVGIGMNAERGPQLLEEVRSSIKTAATPVLLLTREDAHIELMRRYELTPGVAVRQAGVGEEAITRTVESLVQTSSGGAISEDEAREYAMRSLGAMRDLAVSGNAVLNVSDASVTLVSALAEANGAMRTRLADILSRLKLDRAQRAVMDSALNATGEEQLGLLAMVGDSAKRHGNMLESRQINRLLEMASKGTDAEATAAASLLGALNVPNDQLLPLILAK